MTEFGFTLSSEEHRPESLVEQAVEAERRGFDFLSISDHFHPWVDRQGNSPFVWGSLGAVAQATEAIPVITGVTCPTTRIHPAIIAQAAATAASLMPGRFSLGVGSGENLNEHILGDRWPSVAIRQERLEEAVEVIREFWQGGLISHRGEHYEVENARIYTLPDPLPPILVATAGDEATKMASMRPPATSTSTRSGSPSSAAPTPTPTSMSSASTWRRASPTSTSTRSVRRARDSSSSTSPRCCPRSARGETVDPGTPRVVARDRPDGRAQSLCRRPCARACPVVEPKA